MTSSPAEPNAAAPAVRSRTDTIVRVVYAAAIDEFTKGSGRDEVLQALRDRGLGGEIADAVVGHLLEARGDALRAAKRKNAWKHIGIGAAAAIVGAASTLVTYQSAVSYGGVSYTAAWIAMAVGAIELVRGLIQLADAADVSDADVRRSWLPPA
ncbi:MAG TPA: hypothetical protein VIF14_01285 [Alphaproteobacteria bacterium]|jgi:hypothetical protein